MDDTDPLISGAEAAEDTLAMRAAVARVEAALLGRAVEPPRLGRYVVGDRIGSGAFGVVYQGFDPELRRDVAIKLLQTPASSSSGSRARLLREARSLSRVLHPNVVPIYDAGSLSEHGVDRVYLVMERVAGGSLAKWIGERRSWPDIRRVFMGAGRGLAATHAAGMVHRDVKPSNVLVTGDGVAKVVDFGLAALYSRAEASAAGAEPYVEDLLRTEPNLVGTPAYMAPEQLAGERVDHRSDQYAFCLSLAEAIGVAPPPAPGGASALLQQRRRPLVLRDPPDGVPTEVLAVLRRGLAPDPKDRFASMEMLLAALQRTGAPGRWKIAGAYVAGVGLFAAAMAVVWPRSEDQCSDDPLARVWSPTERTDTQGLLSSSVGADAAGATIGVIDDYAHRLREEWTSACGAVDQGSPVELVRWRQQCLAQRRHALRTVVAMLVRDDIPAVRRGSRAAAVLPSIADCAETAAPAWLEPAPSEELEASASQVEEAIAEAMVFRDAGEFESAMRSLQAVATEPAASGETPLGREVAVVRATILEDLGRYAEAIAEAEPAYYASIAAGDRQRARHAAIELAVFFTQSGDYATARRWLADAVAHADEQPTLLTVREQHVTGVLELFQGDAIAALPHFGRALEILAALGGDDGVRRSIMGTKGAALDAAGRPHEALAVQEEVQSMIVASLGPRHPDRVTSLINIGHVHRRLWDLEAARAAYALALDIAAEAQVHPVDVVGAELGLAGAEALLGVGEPLQRIARAKAEITRSLPAEHPQHAAALVTEADVLREAGEHEQAVARAHAGLAALEAAFGPEHHYIGATQCVLGVDEVARGRLDLGRAALRRCVEIYEAALPAGHVDLGDALGELGHAELLAGDVEAARDHLARGLAIAEARNVNASRLARIRGDLERAKGGK